MAFTTAWCILARTNDLSTPVLAFVQVSCKIHLRIKVICGNAPSKDFLRVVLMHSQVVANALLIETCAPHSSRTKRNRTMW